jgi:hypothetical protein
MIKCLFCDDDLDPGSEEHVFLSALGGRIATRRATCGACNNAFANNETGKIDDALAEGFKEIRNGLKIWSGRRNPPPTLIKAGTMPGGGEFDLAPGFIPLMRPGRPPKKGELALGKQMSLIARDTDDVRRLMEIMAKRGFGGTGSTATCVVEKTPPVSRGISFDGPKVWRTVAKTAAVAFVVLYGNEQAHEFLSKELRAAIRYGTPAINNFAGWDFTNEWPNVKELQPHKNSIDAAPSSFEHSVVIADVQSHSVAYVTIFGDWRFSVLLGPKTGLPMSGLAVNPRSLKPARFVIDAKAPDSYTPKNPASFSTEHAYVLIGIKAAFERALQKWSNESHTSYIEDLSSELMSILQESGSDESKRMDAIGKFVERMVTVEHGVAWATELGTLFDEDGKSTSADA